MTRTSMKRMTRKYSDVLQNIEMTLHQARRKNPSIDDRIAFDALRCTHNSEVPDDICTIDLVEALIDVEELRSDIPEPIWQECLRVVMESVKNHSKLKPGETGYLDFIKTFLQHG